MLFILNKNPKDAFNNIKVNFRLLPWYLSSHSEIILAESSISSISVVQIYCQELANVNSLMNQINGGEIPDKKHILRVGFCPPWWSYI